MLTYDEIEKAAEELAPKLEDDMKFTARELGFDDHSAIGKAAREILARRVAREMLRWRDMTNDIARRTVEKRRKAV